MTFTDFCERMLIALYQEGSGSSGWISFEHLRKMYGFEVDPNWSFRAMEHLKSQGWIDGRSLPGGPESTVLGRITGSGMMCIESKYGSKDGVGIILSKNDPEAAIEIVEAEKRDTSQDQLHVHQQMAGPIPPKPSIFSQGIDWGKWGSIATIVGVPLAIILWWLS